MTAPLLPWDPDIHELCHAWLSGPRNVAMGQYGPPGRGPGARWDTPRETAPTPAHLCQLGPALRWRRVLLYVGERIACI